MYIFVYLHIYIYVNIQFTYIYIYRDIVDMQGSSWENHREKQKVDFP